jgi:D-arabinose 1-dehydrogenase-like Zn-dependent alcohol dehydrogenase
MPMMRAIRVSSPGADFELVNIEVPVPEENEVLIRVEACGICRGDLLAKDGHWPGIKYPIIPGHEVVGVVEAVGSQATDWEIGQRVGVGWHGGHCFRCSACRMGDFWGCDNSLITGLSTDGGYAEYMAARSEALVRIPNELTSVEAAPLLCAGRTTFGALQNCGAKGGELVAIHGFGGLGHLAVQYSVKLGYKTAILSRGKEKEELAYKLGAHMYIDTNATDAVKELRALGGARVILCTAPNSKAISGLVGGLGRNGKIIIVAGESEPLQFSPSLLLGGRIEEAIRFSMLFGVVPMVEVFPLEQAALAFEKMMTSKVHFRAVLKMD